MLSCIREFQVVESLISAPMAMLHRHGVRRVVTEDLSEPCRMTDDTIMYNAGDIYMFNKLHWLTP